MKLPRYLLACLLLLVLVVNILPWKPVFPSSGLDNAWVAAINEAAARGLAFGQDIIFTFGPYAALYTRCYHPALDGLVFAGGLYLCACLGTLLLLLASRRPLALLACMILVLSPGLNRDGLLFLYPLLLALCCHRLCLPAGNPLRLSLGRHAALILVLLFLPLGLLALVKQSGIVCGLAGLALCSLRLCQAGRSRQAALLWLTTPLGTLALWRLAGQQASALPAYLDIARDIVGGYTEGMQIDASLLLPPCLFLAAAGIIVALSISSGAGRRFPHIFPALCLGLFLFFCFKQNFVRSDAAHTGAAVSSLLTAGLLLFSVQQRQIHPYWLLPPLLCALLLFSGNTEPPARALRGLAQTYADCWQGLAMRLHAGQLERNYQAAWRTIAQERAIPRLAGSTDIYSYGQSYLLASPNQWQPRPVLQSYSTYTPRLQALDLAYLLGAQAPDNIVLRLETIDGRLPALDLNLELAAILQRYSLTGSDAHYLYFRRHDSGPATLELRGLGSTNATMNEKIPVPANGLVFVQLDIEPTLFGRLATLFYKPDDVYLDLQLANGISRRFRLIPAMAHSGFLLNPLANDTADLARIIEKAGYLEPKDQVVALSISNYQHSWACWKPVVAARFLGFTR